MSTNLSAMAVRGQSYWLTHQVALSKGYTQVWTWELKKEKQGLWRAQWQMPLMVKGLGQGRHGGRRWGLKADRPGDKRATGDCDSSSMPVAFRSSVPNSYLPSPERTKRWGHGIKKWTSSERTRGYFLKGRPCSVDFSNGLGNDLSRMAKK